MLLDATKSSLLLIDIQDRLLPAMATSNEVVAKSSILLKAAAELGVPVTISEQYPKGLGHTVPELAVSTATVHRKALLLMLAGPSAAAACSSTFMNTTAHW